MTLHKKAGMWISDWNVSDGSDDEGCYKRQKEQDRKARAIVAKLKTQGWKRIPEKKVNNTLMFIIGSAELLTAIKKYNADVKKKWANKKVSVSIPGRPKKTDPAWRYHSFFPYEKSLESGLKEWLSDDYYYYSFDSYFVGELGGYGALMNKGNQYRLIMTGGSDDDEAAHWSTPVFQLALKGQSKLAKAKPKAKPKTKKTTTRKSKAKPKAKPKPKYYLHVGEDFTFDKDVYTGKKFAMTTIRSAKALANHMFNLGPMPNMTPGYSDFTINGEHYGNVVTWETEIIDANTGEVVDYWTPTKEQKAAYRKKGNAIKNAAKKTTTRKSKAKPKAKPKPIMSGKGQQYVMKGTGRGVKKPAKPKAKPKTKYILGKKDRPTDLKKRKSPPYSAKQFPKGARKKGNNGKMWTIVTDKRGVKRWKA